MVRAGVDGMDSDGRRRLLQVMMMVMVLIVLLIQLMMVVIMVLVVVAVVVLVVVVVVVVVSLVLLLLQLHHCLEQKGHVRRVVAVAVTRPVAVRLRVVPLVVGGDLGSVVQHRQISVVV